ncbi:MAG: pyridoxal-phosphate dependent enzyme [Spirochaetes bacterium]|nr:pyridoxal-phosphate dependent enzyme [Spirochaetota bacterium]
MSVLPLFDAFPALKKLPYVQLGDFPTPVQRLSSMGHPNLWVKRDDVSSTLYGGNKVRKLEFTLAEAIALNKKKVVTMGGIGTNHGLATAVFCKHLGLGCRLLLFWQPVTEYVKKNLLLFVHFGAELAYYTSMLATGIMFYTKERLIRDAYFLYAGGSSPLGTVGFVNAAFELKQQIQQGLLPQPDYVVCALGSSGTMAGLSLGLLLAGVKSKVIGVRVTDRSLGPIPIANEKSVHLLMEKTYKLMKTITNLPPIDIPTPIILHDYCGQGYGYPTGACLDAIEKMKHTEHIQLEPTYTGKTFAAVCDLIRKPEFKNAILLYWHTYNSVDMTDKAANVNYHQLPKNLHWVFERE